MDIKFVIIAILLVISAFIFLGFVYPKFTEIQLIKGQINVENTIKDEAEAKAKVIREEISDYENIKESDLELLDHILPTNNDFPNLFVHVNSLILSSGLITRDIIIEGKGNVVESSGSDEKNVKPTKVSLYNAYNFSKTPVTISAEGSYDSLKEFLKRVEDTLRIMDVQLIEFSPASGGSGFSQGFSFRITADVYHRE